jgi:ankyrin repeat protein
MRSVVTTPARLSGAALILTVLTTPLFIDTPPAARGDDKPAAKPLPAEVAKAIRDGDLKAVRAQLDAGVDVNARDADGNTPLLLAAVYAGPECVELLLKKGAEVNAKNKFGATPLHRAATNYEKAKLLIDAGADVKAKTKSGRTVLTLAARKYGNSQTVKQLLDKGADAKERNDSGANPIQVAAYGGDLDTLKLLVEAGADVNDFTAVVPRAAFVARTPLGWAAYRNDVPMVRCLLERKADPNKATALGPPLTFAAWGSSVQAAEVLLAHGARTDVKGGDGMSKGEDGITRVALPLPPQAALLLPVQDRGQRPERAQGDRVAAALRPGQEEMRVTECETWPRDRHRNSLSGPQLH